MGLSMKDMVKGTIVDWREEWHPEERETTLRNPWMRGIITKVVSSGDSVSEVWVKFSDDEDAIKVQPRELTRYLPWNSPQAKREMARISGNRELSGVFDSKPARVKPRGIDKLGLTKGKASALVRPENEEPEDVESLAHREEPIVIPITEEESDK